jgi:hypothetical protein
MTAKKVFGVILCIFFTVSCAYLKSTRSAHSKSYALNIEEQASVGAPMIISEYTTYATAPHKYGLVEEQDRWQSFDYPTDDSFKEKLIYTGLSNNTIHISYKKYKRNRASPEFSQELAYDLRHADIIVFKNYKIKIINATNEYVRFKILSD